MNLPIETLLILAAVSQQASEHMLGSFLQGYQMKFASLGMGVVTAFVFWVLDLQGMAAYSYLSVAALGVLAGLGSNVVHGLIEKFTPAANAKPLLGVLAKPKD